MTYLKGNMVDILHKPDILYRSDYNRHPENNEFLLFALYFNIGNYSEEKSKEHIRIFSHHLDELFNDVMDRTKYLIKYVIIPVNNEKTRLECIYPSNEKDVDIDIESLLKKKDTNLWEL